MSFQAMAWASEQKTGSCTRKAVLYALANHANREGECYMRIETICDEAEIGDTAARSALTHLVENLGVKRNRERRADGTLGIYHFALPLPSRGEQPASPNDARPASPGDAQEPGSSSEPIDLAATPRKRNIIWDCLVDAGFSEPGTPSERSDFGKTVRELREVIPKDATALEIVKAIRLRKLAWERTYPDARFTHHVLRGKWSDLGALAGTNGNSASESPYPMLPDGEVF